MTSPSEMPNWEEFRRVMRDLEARVAQLEARLGEPATVTTPMPAAPATEHAHIALAAGAGAVPIAGRVLLGIAGAYLLRALTEANALPQQAGVSAGIVYSIFWLAWAARVGHARRFEAALYSLASALILTPLLWESTVRFHALTAWTAAAVLLAFTLFGLIISWRRNLQIVATIAILTGVLSATALLIGTYDLVPFTSVLLAIAAAVEVSACLDHWLNERWLAALATDLAVLLAAILVTRPSGLPEAYAPVSRAALLAMLVSLPAIYLSSTTMRTLFRGFAFTGFEAAQLALAMFLVVGGGLRLANGSLGVIVALAAVCLCCGGACYLSALRLGAGRNANIYAVFGLLLLLAGTIIVLPPLAAAAAWSVLAVALLVWPRQPLRWHAAVYLLLALLLSAALTGATRTLLGADNAHAIPPTVFWESAAAAACYALAVKQKALRLFRGILAATAVWLLAGASAAGLTSAYHALFGPLAPHAFCATLRTVVLAAGAMLLAAAARRWQRLELRPLVYIWMPLGAYRLLILDLHQDIKAAVVLSLLAYGAALTLLPRLIASAR